MRWFVDIKQGDAMAKTKCKYKTYTELAEAFSSGELDKKKYVLVMDNDYCSLNYRGDDMDENEAYDHCQTLFRGGGYGDIIEVCEAAGIPAEWC